MLVKIEDRTQEIQVGSNKLSQEPYLGRPILVKMPRTLPDGKPIERCHMSSNHLLTFENDASHTSQIPDFLSSSSWCKIL